MELFYRITLTFVIAVIGYITFTEEEFWLKLFGTVTLIMILILEYVDNIRRNIT